MRVLVAAFLLAGTAWADCPQPEGVKAGAVSSRSDGERLEFLAAQLDAQAQEHQRWALGWGLSYTTLAIGQVSIIPLFDEEFDVDWWWGAVTAALGVPLVAAASADYVVEGPRFAQRAASPGDDTCKLIAEGERLLFDGATAQHHNSRWYLHVINVVVNLGLAAILVFGHERPWWIGLLNFGLGAPLGELTLFSTPSGLSEAVAQYRDGKAPAKVSVRLVPMGLGVALLGRF